MLDAQLSREERDEARTGQCDDVQFFGKMKELHSKQGTRNTNSAFETKKNGTATLNTAFTFAK